MVGHGADYVESSVNWQWSYEVDGNTISLSGTGKGCKGSVGFII